MKVLIALDATPQCVEIAKEAASRPWPAGTEFLLVHVLDPFPFAKAPLSFERAKAAAEEEIRNAGTSLVHAGWKMEADVVPGLARKALAQTAESWRADLVLVGSNESGALTRLFLGSTARSVLRDAPCSVEIVRPQSEEKGRGTKILIATDGSEYSTVALRCIASRPWPKGSKVRVISIPEPFMPLEEFPQFELKEIESLNTAALKDAQRYAQAGVEILKKAGMDTEGEALLPRDSDAREIVKEAKRWKADIVVVGSHGRRGFDRWTLGSVSEHVAFHAPCSVEVIRAPKARSGKKKGAKP